MMQLFQKIKYFLVIPFLCILASCIYVGDIGVYWGKGVLDPALDGPWADNSSKDCLSFAVEDNNYRVTEGGKKDESLYRTLLLGDNKFLMVKDPNNKYMLIKYKVAGGIFTTYMPDEAKKVEFLRDNPDSGIVISEGDYATATIPVLNEKSIELLQKIADDESYWKSAAVQHRVKNCKTQNGKH